MATERLPLADIVADPAIQPRAAGLDEHHVEELRAAYERGDDLPKPVVWRVGANCKDAAFKLSQGFHRFAAARKAGLDHLACDVRAGTEFDCAIDAFTSNQGHGLKRTPEDKRRAIAEILKLCPDWTDLRIAEKLGVSDKTVADERRSRESVSEIPKQTRRVGKDGKTYTTNKPKAGGKKRADKPAPNASKDKPASDASSSSAQTSTETTPPPADETPAARNERLAVDHVAEVEAICRDLDALAKRLDALKASPLSHRGIHADSAAAGLRAVRKQLWVGRPCHRCPYCKGDGCPPDKDGRAVCHGTGWVKKAVAESAEEALA